MEVNKAWEQSKDEIDQTSRYGTWNKDYFLSKPDPSGRFCHADEIRSVDCYMLFQIYTLSSVLVTSYKIVLSQQSLC